VIYQLRENAEESVFCVLSEELDLIKGARNG